MAVFSPKEDEVLALGVGNFLLLAGFFVIVATQFWWLGLIPASIGIYVLVVSFKAYRWEPLKEWISETKGLLKAAVMEENK